MVLELEKITKHYEVKGSHNRREILHEISLQIQKTDSIAITGPSGSGKSTLLNIMGTLDSPSSGLVKINGIEVKKLNEPELAKIRNQHIGFVFQLHHLLPQLNLIENVLLPTIARDKKKRNSVKQKALELIDYVGLSDKILQRPGQLSVGECQRAAVVRALINDPEIILADEPTGSLDEDTAEQIGDLLLKINAEQKIALVVVTHSEKLAGKLNVVCNLSNGKLVEI